MILRLSRLTTGVMVLVLLPLVAAFAGGEKNLLPRFPEFVIERGYSDAFEVVECHAQTRIIEDTAESQVRVILKNISDKPIESAVKVRILYLNSEQSAKIFVNGQARNFSRKNPRIPFSLAAGQTIDLQIQARHNIQFNLDVLKKEVEHPSSEQEPKKKKFSLDELTKLFERENFGRRFMIGSLVSKWGIFPIDFKKIQVEVTVPRDFAGVFGGGSVWDRKEKNSNQVFSFEGIDGFASTLFLPKKDVKPDQGIIQGGAGEKNTH